MIIYIVAAFLLTFSVELISDVKGARLGKNDDHKTDTIIRELVLAAGAWFSSGGDLVMAVSYFATANFVFWVLFDAAFNLAQKKSLFYTGDGVKDSFLDTVFSKNPVLFFVTKVVLATLSVAALMIPLASYFVLFWSFFALFLLAIFSSKDVRYIVLREYFSVTTMIFGLLDFCSAIIFSNQGIPDLYILISFVTPFTTVVLLSNLYYKIWK